MFRNFGLMTLFVLCASVFAADKPAAQARQEMSNEVPWSSEVFISENGLGYDSSYDYFGNNEGTKPAAQARLNMDSDTVGFSNFAVVSGEEHPINASFEETVPASLETRVYAPIYGTRYYGSFNSSSKPAAHARLEMEQGD